MAWLLTAEHGIANDAVTTQVTKVVAVVSEEVGRVAAKDPIVRRLAAQIASNAYRADPDARRVRPPALPDEMAAQYLSQVDPDGLLDRRERLQRATAAWRHDVASEALATYKAERGDGQLP